MSPCVTLSPYNPGDIIHASTEAAYRGTEEAKNRGFEGVERVGNKGIFAP